MTSRRQGPRRPRGRRLSASPLVRQALLLLPQPLLSVAYLGAVRGQTLPASFAPLALLALLPIASIAMGLMTVWRGVEPDRRRLHLILVIIGALELVWTIFGQAVIGFAIALRSG